MILYTLLTNQQIQKTIKVYFVLSIFTILFSVVYEAFSHGVYSIYMIGLFLIPSVFGLVIYTLIDRFEIVINRLSFNLYNSAIITLMLGFCLQGILEIYGTSSIYIYVYFGLSLSLLVLALVNMKKTV